MKDKKDKKGKSKDSPRPESPKLEKQSFQIDDWKEETTKEVLNSSDFQCAIAIIVESHPDKFEITETYRNFLKEQNDYLIQSLSYGDINENVSKTSLSLITGKFESAVLKLARKEIQSQKTELSVNLLALWLKLNIIILRNKYVSHKTNYLKLQKAMNDELYGTVEKQDEKPAKGKDKKGKNDKKADKGAKKDKKKEVKTLDINERMVPRQSTLIRSEMRKLKQDENFCIPAEGIDVFFLLSDFYDPLLLEELEIIGCPVNCLINFAINLEAPNLKIELSNDAQDAEKLKKMREFWSFWSENDCGTSNNLPESTFYMCYIPERTEEENYIADDVLRILYNIHDFKRQYLDYLQHLKVLDVSENKPVKNSRRFKIYSRILDAVPPECVNVPLILFAMVQEVATKCNDELKCDNEKFTPFDFENEAEIPKKTHGNVREISAKLIESCEIPTAKNLTNKTKRTVDVPYGNALKYTSAHSAYSKDICQASVRILKSIPPFRSLRRRKLTDNHSFVLYSYLFNKWCRQFGEIDTEQMTHCLNAYLFQNASFDDPLKPNDPLNSSIVEDLVFHTQKPHNRHHKNHPFLYIGPFHDKRSVDKPTVRSTEAPTGTLEVVYVENHDSSASAQTINGAFNDFKHCAHKYYPPNDELLLKFFNGGEEVECVDRSLRTPVNFRDFCSFVVAEQLRWLLEREDLRWKRLDRLANKLEFKVAPFVFEDYILPGSIKDKIRLRKIAEEQKIKEELNKKDKKGKDAKKGKEKPEKKEKGASKKNSSDKKPPKKPSKGDSKSQSVTEPKKPLEIINPCFEGYNLGDEFLKLTETITNFNSVDGISVEIRQTQCNFSKNETTLKIRINENNLVLHLTQNERENFNFHLNLFNGAVMVFAKPVFAEIVAKEPVIPEVVVSKESLMSSEENAAPEVTKSFHEENNAKEKLTPDQFCRKILETAENCLPIFKICSSRIHKFYYVKRVARRLAVPVGEVVRNIFFKPKMVPRKKKPFVINGPKFFPYSRKQFDKLPPMEYEWKASLPTGLHIETVRSPVSKPFYITQKYLRSRTELQLTSGEVYRCLLRCGSVLKFMQNGDLTVYHPDKTIRTVKYGCASPKTIESISTEVLGRHRIEKDPKIYPMHAMATKPSVLQRKLRKLNKRYRKHLIGVSGSFRMPSLRKYTPPKKKGVLPEDLMISEVVLEADGAETFIKNHEITRETEKYYTLTYTNCSNMEILTHRQDGTTSLINKEGILVTQFPDGTRITSWPTFDDENFCCDGFSLDGEESEGFVLVALSFRFEHPYFATVEYCNGEDTVQVALPDGVSVKIYGNGSYHVNLPKDDWLSVNKNDVVFTASTCTNCKGQANVLLSTQPLYENVSEVDGDLLYYRATDNKIFQVSHRGEPKSSKPEPTEKTDTECGCDTHKSPVNERYISLRRDYSCSEYYYRKPPVNFGSTMVEFTPIEATASYKNDPHRDLVCSMPLKKTYMENLMMFYDDPLLSTADKPEHLECVSFGRKRGCCDVIAERTPVFVVRRTVKYLPLVDVGSELAEIISQCVDHEKKYNGVLKGSFINALVDSVKAQNLRDSEETEVSEENSFSKSYESNETYIFDVWERNEKIRRKIEEYKLLIKMFYDPEHLKTLKYPFDLLLQTLTNTYVLNLPWGPYRISNYASENASSRSETSSETIKPSDSESFVSDYFNKSGDFIHEPSEESLLCCNDQLKIIYLNEKYSVEPSVPHIIMGQLRLNESFNVQRDASKLKLSSATNKTSRNYKDFSETLSKEISKTTYKNIEVVHENSKTECKSLNDNFNDGNGSGFSDVADKKYSSLSDYLEKSVVDDVTSKSTEKCVVTRGFPSEESVNALETCEKQPEEVTESGCDGSPRAAPHENGFGVFESEEFAEEITSFETYENLIQTPKTPSSTTEITNIPFHRHSLKLPSTNLSEISGYPLFPMSKNSGRCSSSLFRDKKPETKSSSASEATNDDLNAVTVYPLSLSAVKKNEKGEFVIYDTRNESETLEVVSDGSVCDENNESLSGSIICPESASVSSDLSTTMSKSTVKPIKRSVNPCGCVECDCSVYQMFKCYPEMQELDENTQHHFSVISERIITALTGRCKDGQFVNLTQTVINATVFKELQHFRFTKADLVPFLRIFEAKVLKHCCYNDKVKMPHLILVILGIVREEIEKKNDSFSLVSYKQCDLRYTADLINVKFYKLKNSSRFEVIIEIINMLNDAMYEYNDIEFVLDVVSNKYKNSQENKQMQRFRELQTINRIIFHIEKTIFIVMQNKFKDEENFLRENTKKKRNRKLIPVLPACDKQIHVKKSSDRMIRSKSISSVMKNSESRENVRKKVVNITNVGQPHKKHKPLTYKTKANDSSKISQMSRRSESLDDFVFEDYSLRLPKKRLFVKSSDGDLSNDSTYVCKCASNIAFNDCQKLNKCD